jgi:LmbE family N-acetylglucosaminyl deacetylase
VELGTVVGIWAHPDDETYLSAGLMAAAVRAGSRVVCVTATRGEGGSTDEDRWPPATMAAVRELELLRSFEVLGVTEHRFLDLPDVDMDTGLPDSGALDVAAVIAEVRPDTVLTFGPDGMTGHRAHQDVSRWTTEGFTKGAPPGSRLHYATISPAWAAEFVPSLNRFDVYRPGTPPVTPVAEMSIHHELEDELLDLKLRAIEEHESQVGAMVEAFGRDFFRRAMGEECFREAGRQADPEGGRTDTA